MKIAVLGAGAMGSIYGLIVIQDSIPAILDKCKS